MAYKRFIDETHYTKDTIENDVFDGINTGLKVCNKLGISPKNDIKNLKGYSVAEMEQMSLSQLKKKKNLYLFRIAVSIMIMPSLLGGIYLLLTGAGVGLPFIYGLIALVLFFKSKKQYKLFNDFINTHFN